MQARLGLFIFLSFSIFSISKAQNTCSEVFSGKPKISSSLGLTSKEFWAQEKVYFKTDQGVYKHFSFSLDSETRIAQTVKFLRKNFPHLLARFDQLDDQNPMKRERLLRELNLSEKQLTHFALRPEVDKNLPQYFLYDLQPEMMESMIMKNAYGRSGMSADIYLGKFVVVLSQALDEAYKEMALPLEAEADGNRPETRYKTFETNPARFVKQIKDLKKFFDKPQTHLHMGIPNEVSISSVYRIARAVETKIILALAAENSMREVAYSYFTTLVTDPTIDHQTRGVISLHTNLFKTPFAMHDLEIREYFTIEEGLSDLQLAATLAQNHLELKEIPTLEIRLRDQLTANLKGALFYVGQALSNSRNVQEIELGKQMIQLSEELTEKTMKDEVLREKISHFLNQNQIDRRIKPELFLNQATN